MTKAAELLGISQPAVSRLIADFQGAVGFRLFKRGRNSAEPTPDALLLFEQVERLFYGMEELGREIVAINNMQTGRLVISATSSYAVGFLPEAIADFKRKYPNIMISLHIQAHEQVIDWVSSGRADIGFAIQPVAKSDLTAVQIASREAPCVFPAGHPLEEKKTLKPADVADMPFVSFPRGSALRFQIDGLFDRAGIDRQLQSEATSHHAVCAFVSSGLGVALVSPYAPIEGYPNKLASRPMSPGVLIEIQMIYNERALSLVASQFKEFVSAEVSKRFP